MKNIFAMCDEWATKTYGDILEADYRDDVYYECYKKALMESGLYNKKMVGESVEGLLEYDPAEKDGGIFMTGIFQDTIIDREGNVCDYVIAIIKAAIKKNKSNIMILGWIGRSLRSFPSFLREIALKADLCEFFRDSKDFSIERDPKMDLEKHVDLTLTYKGTKYFIWVYQISKKGVNNTREKLLGKRDGDFSYGLNVLCSIEVFNNTNDKVKYNGWIFYGRSYIQKIIDIIDNDEPEPYHGLCDALEKEFHYYDFPYRRSCIGNLRMVNIEKNIG